MAEKQKTFTFLPKIINGGLAGFIGVCCVFPFDLVKTRIQNQRVRSDGKKLYSSIPDALFKTFRKEGFFGMYQGAGINLLLIVPEKAIKLATNDYFRFMLKNKDNSIPLYRQIMAGGGSAICQMVVTTPMELIKIQMQDRGRLVGGKVELTTVGVVANIFKKYGILGFYKGIGPNLMRDVPFAMVYFPLFAFLNGICPVQADGDAQPWCTFGSGLSAGGLSAIFVTPCDVIKTRIQTYTRGKGEEKYSGFLSAFVTILRKEGWKALFKGGACRIMVIAPKYAIVQVVYYLGVGEFILGIEKHV